MISFHNVSMQFPMGNAALKDVSFEIKENEFVFLVGPSGAGKTTILKLILRQHIPTAGTILVNGLEVSDPQFNQTESLRRMMGVVFQDFKILPDKNVFENIALSLAFSPHLVHKLNQRYAKHLN